MAVLRYLRTVLIWAIRFVLATTTCWLDGRRRSTLSRGCMLLDVFVFDFSFDSDGRFLDRYYPGLADLLTEEERCKLYYYPTLRTGLRGLPATLRKLRAAKEKFVLPEDYLTLSDLGYAFLCPFRSVRKRLPSRSLCGVEISPLIRATWLAGIFSNGPISALIKFRTARRWAIRGEEIRLVVDWFENQGDR